MTSFGVIISSTCFRHHNLWWPIGTPLPPTACALTARGGLNITARGVVVPRARGVVVLRAVYSYRARCSHTARGAVILRAVYSYCERCSNTASGVFIPRAVQSYRARCSHTASGVVPYFKWDCPTCNKWPVTRGEWLQTAYKSDTCVITKRYVKTCEPD